MLTYLSYLCLIEFEMDVDDRVVVEEESEESEVEEESEEIEESEESETDAVRTGISYSFL